MMVKTTLELAEEFQDNDLMVMAVNSAAATILTGNQEAYRELVVLLGHFTERRRDEAVNRLTDSP